jgi:type I restriction enzyme S subunit
MTRSANALPNGWAPAKIEVLADSISTTDKKVRTKDALLEGRYPVVDQGLSPCSGYLNDEALLVPASAERPVILFGDHTRIVKFIDYPFIPGADGTKLLQSRTEVLPRYFYYLLKAADVPDRGYGRHFGHLKAVNFPLAPRLEQKRIADRLDTVLSRVNAVNTRLARVAPILKRFRQSVLAAATSGRLTEDWREHFGAESSSTFALSDLVVSIDQGWSPKCEADAAPPDRWAVIKTTAIQALHFYPSENKALPNDLDPRPNLALADGDVLITRAGPRSRAGIACVVKGDHPMLMLCDKAYRVRVDRSKVLPQMLNLLLNSPEVLDVIDGMKTGISESGVNLTQAKFRELALSVPHIAEQAEIIRRVDTLFAFADRLEARLQTAQTATERLTPALLAKAFRGELVPQDPNDEPASELLRRLQAQAPTSKPKRGRKAAA